jgi:hypothetical protein
MGRMEDDEDPEDVPYPRIWISGEAGWFTVHPHERYAVIYNEMCQVTTLYYNILDVYRAAGRNCRKPAECHALYASLDVREVFLQVQCASHPDQNIELTCH